MTKYLLHDVPSAILASAVFTVSTVPTTSPFWDMRCVRILSAVNSRTSASIVRKFSPCETAFHLDVPFLARPLKDKKVSNTGRTILEQTDRSLRIIGCLQRSVCILQLTRPMLSSNNYCIERFSSMLLPHLLR